MLSSFWIKDTGWLKASLLEQGMILLDRNNQEVEVISQYLLPNHTDTVYNIEVNDFHTYHVGRLGVWVHNDGCCGVQQKPIENLSKPLSKSTTDHISNRHDYNLVKKQIEAIVNKTGKTKEEAIKMLNIGDRTFLIRIGVMKLL
ncbi:Protein of uncharacterised function (DUF1557) [Moraxella ovis]|uniref:Protein of uncharacterized function (DUF1557) n=1 Tax=Moraxella ovis TaxID=29433 RepID=A0A378PN89_9GAMM|nr:Protein of uncharacterised function (DUF1557) [Moraxella ovis]